MANEIERKFLVTGNFKSQATSSLHITQGYLSSIPGRTVRIRIRGEKGYLTIKGMSNESGTTRFEWEKEIDIDDANNLLKICEPGIIDRTRFLVPCGNFTFEVDEFYGENEGLILAEIELTAENDNFEKPAWLGEEVTGDIRFYNTNLVKNPFNNWKRDSLKT
jgi:adenylate cyclase